MSGGWRLVSKTTGKTVVARLEIAAGFWSRLVGLQFRRKLPADSAVLLAPCNSVHTCFLRFPLDVVYLDRRGVVLAVRHNLRPWRLSLGPRQSHAVLELPAGASHLLPGESLFIDSTSPKGELPPRAARFLSN